MPEPVLDIQGLTTSFSTPRGIARAVDTASLTLEQGETLGLVGESGCGKTVLALSVLGLVPNPPGKVTDGKVLYRGRDLLEMSDRELQRVRGKHISMVFQEPMTSLNPVFRVGAQVAETLRLHQGLSARESMGKAIDMLDRTGVPDPKGTARRYPHELSGGMRQRVLIAMALICEPDLIIADEPTTALDVTIQAQILDLLQEMRDSLNSSGLLITHDLGVVARLCRKAAVMYSGRIVEQSMVRELYHEPLHPYTMGLLASLPVPGKTDRLHPIPGLVPSIFEAPNGCRFHPRCPQVMDKCRKAEPELIPVGDGRKVRCWLHQ